MYSVDIAAIPIVPFKDRYTEVRIYDVHDGDSLKCIFMIDNTPVKISIRVNGVDAPEVSRASAMEKRAGLIVKRIVQDHLQEKITYVIFREWDKYGGRIIADVYLSFVTLTEFLLNNGLAHPYDGKHKKIPWSEAELKYIIDNYEYSSTKNRAFLFNDDNIFENENVF